MADETYFIRFRGQVTGPFTREQVIAKARAKVVTPVHSISTDQVTWTMAKSFDWMFAPASALAAAMPVSSQSDPVSMARGAISAKADENSPGVTAEERVLDEERVSVGGGGNQLLPQVEPSNSPARQNTYLAEFHQAAYKRIRPVLGVWLALISIVPFGLAGFFLGYSQFRERFGQMPGAGTAGELVFWLCYGVGFAFVITGIFGHLREMYRGWKHVIHWNRTSGMLTSVSSPDSAVGLLFVPFFGQFYWVFRHYGIGDDLNQLIDRGLVHHPHLPSWMAIVMCICLWLSQPVIVIIGLLLALNGLVQQGQAVSGILFFLTGLIGLVFMILYLTKVGYAFDEVGKTLGGVD